MRSRAIHTTYFRCNSPYSLGPVVVPGYWLIARRRFAFSLPVFHSVSHWVLVLDLIDLLWADFIFMVGGMALDVAAAFSA